MKTVPMGCDIIVSWRLVDANGRAINLGDENITLSYTNHGRRVIADNDSLSLQEGLITWFLPASEQYGEGVYSLDLNSGATSLHHGMAFSVIDIVDGSSTPYEINITDIL